MVVLAAVGTDGFSMVGVCFFSVVLTAKRSSVFCFAAGFCTWHIACSNVVFRCCRVGVCVVAGIDRFGELDRWTLVRFVFVGILAGLVLAIPSTSSLFSITDDGICATGVDATTLSAVDDCVDGGGGGGEGVGVSIDCDCDFSSCITATLVLSVISFGLFDNFVFSLQLRGSFSATFRSHERRLLLFDDEDDDNDDAQSPL